MQNFKTYQNIETDLELTKLYLQILDIETNHLQITKDANLKLEHDLRTLKNQMATKLKELKGIEQELLSSILIDGNNVTRAVDIVAFTYDLDPSTIWKNYYPKVKQILQEFKSS